MGKSVPPGPALLSAVHECVVGEASDEAADLQSSAFRIYEVVVGRAKLDSCSGLYDMSCMIITWDKSSVALLQTEECSLLCSCRPQFESSES